MQTKIARHSVGTIFFLLALLPHFIAPDPAMAFGSILTAWNNLYAPGGVGSQSGANASCALCHDEKAGPNVGYNAYGNLIRQNIGLGNTAAFQAAETANSINVSGVTQNIAEINASTQPGWTSGNSNPIFDLAGAAAPRSQRRPRSGPSIQLPRTSRPWRTPVRTRRSPWGPRSSSMAGNRAIPTWIR